MSNLPQQIRDHGFSSREDMIAAASERARKAQPDDTDAEVAKLRAQPCRFDMSNTRRNPGRRANVKKNYAENGAQLQGKGHRESSDWEEDDDDESEHDAARDSDREFIDDDSDGSADEHLQDEGSASWKRELGAIREELDDLN